MSFVDRGIQWNGDGSYTPVCEPCGWSGKPRWTHSAAAAAVRSHVASKRHLASEVSVDRMPDYQQAFLRRIENQSRS